jgi:HEAT repeat protein
MESTWPAADELKLRGRIQPTAGRFGPAGTVAILLACLITSLMLFTDTRGNMAGGIPAIAPNPPHQLQAIIEGDLVTLKARSVPVEAVLSELARQSNLEIRADGPIAEPISIELERVPLPEALHLILRNCDYALQYNSNEATEGSPTDKPHRTLWVYSTNREIDGQIKSGDDPQSSPIDVDSLNNVQNLENIANLEQHDALMQLNLALTDEDPAVRKYAIEMLAGIGGEEALSALVSALWDSAHLVREEAAHAIGEIGGTTAVQYLRLAMADQNNGVREAAVAALFDIGSAETTQLLGAALYDPNTSVREEAVYALGDIGGDATISFLQQALRDDDVGVRIVAVETASDIGGEESFRLLRFALQNRSATVREAAIYELGNTGSDDAHTLINSALNDQDPRVREAARDALENLPNPCSPVIGSATIQLDLDPD